MPPHAEAGRPPDGRRGLTLALVEAEDRDQREEHPKHHHASSLKGGHHGLSGPLQDNRVRPYLYKDRGVHQKEEYEEYGPSVLEEDVDPVHGFWV